MLTLATRAAVRAAIRDPALAHHLRALLALRLDEIDGYGAILHIVQPGDGIADAEAAVGFPMIHDGACCWDWARAHPGGITECCFVLSDDGPAQVLIAGPDACPAILDVIRAHA